MSTEENTLSKLSSLELTQLLQYIFHQDEINLAIHHFATFCNTPNFPMKINPKLLLQKWKNLIDNKSIYFGFKHCILCSNIPDKGKAYLCEKFNMYLFTLYKIIIIKNVSRGQKTKVFT